MRTRRLVTLASVIATLAVSAAPAFAQTPSAPTSNNLILSPWLSYAAKFICGMENGQLNERMVVNGRYRDRDKHP